MTKKTRTILFVTGVGVALLGVMLYFLPQLGSETGSELGSGNSSNNNADTSNPTNSETLTENSQQMNPNYPTILFIGDSLTEGHDLQPEFSFPSQVKALLSQANIMVNVINAGVSGDTSSGGLIRLKWYLENRSNIDIVVVSLGANDGLRGLPIENLKANLEKIIELSQGAGHQVVLSGMQVPLNYGTEYSSSFKKIYPELVAKYGIKSVPFLLEGVAGMPQYNLEDNIHPNAEGYAIVANNVYKVLLPLLAK